MLGSTKKRKRKKNRDGAWHPRQNAGVRDVSSFTTENLLRLMQAASSPAPKMAVLNSSRTAVVEGETKVSTPTGKHSSEVLTPSRYQASTPEAGPRTRFLVTPKGTKLVRSRLILVNDGEIGVFITQNKAIEKDLTLPVAAKPWIENSPIPAVDMGGMIDIEITKKQIKKVEAISRKRKKEGVDPRKISQNKLNGIPATQAMRKSGIAINNGDGHYAHFIPFSFLGDAAQSVNNMGIGTRHANAAMELVNPAIRRLLYMKNGPQAVYLSAIPEWVPGFEKIRLLKSLTYIIKDKAGDDFTRSAKVTFNMLSLTDVCLSDVHPVRKSIINSFLGIKKPALDLTSPVRAVTKRPAPTNPLLSPQSSPMWAYNLHAKKRKTRLPEDFLPVSKLKFT